MTKIEPRKPSPPAPDAVTLTIDGKEVTVPKGTLIIRAAEQLGVEIPRFCDHPFLAPAGACRQCYVEIEGQPKLATSCTVPVAPGMVVRTQNSSENVEQAQVANLEFLLLNHPLDCPICDRGGECPLQDQAMAFGPGESRFIEAKRTFKKPIPLSPLVNLDRERCVLCQRCTRFCDEISGDRFIELFERGARQQVSIAAGEDFQSPYSGNTVQICPVGALTSETFRFVARPFDLSTGDTVCPHCSSGCNVRVDTRRGEVVRVLARDNADVNDAWNCDKGRYAFRFADSPSRITTPLIREKGLEPASFGEVFDSIVSWSRGKRVAFLTGGRLMDEDYYALSKLARVAFKTNDVDHRRSDAAIEVEASAASSPLTVTYRDIEKAKVIVLVGLDAENTSPILHLRLRKAARRGVSVTVIHPRATRLADVAEHILCRPGDEATVLGAGGSALDSLAAAGEAGVVLAGPQLDAAGMSAAHALATKTGAKFGLVGRRANDRGALVGGAHPALLPGGRRLDDAGASQQVAEVWGGALPTEVGRDWRGILEACANREIDVLFLIGVDPLRDYPDAALVERALDNVAYKVVQSLELGSLEMYADAYLPAAAFLEKNGHVTDWEGRSQRLRPVRPTQGVSRADWEIFAGLAQAMGTDLGFGDLEQLHAEMGQLLAAPQQTPTPTVPETPAVIAPPAAAKKVVTDAGTSAGDGLVLLTYPLLVDEGRLSDSADELKSALELPAWVEMNTADAQVLGVQPETTIRISTSAGAAELPVTVTDHIARGTVFVPFNQPGLSANTLLSGSFTTVVTIETASGAATATIDGGAEGER